MFSKINLAIYCIFVIAENHGKMNIYCSFMIYTHEKLYIQDFR